MTAIEFLVEQITNSTMPVRIAIEHAKEMEKKQMLDIYIRHNQYNDEYETFEQYYNETFKSE
jgi:hypothetical protein